MNKTNTKEWKEIGKVGVDSASLLIIDPAYIPPAADIDNLIEDYLKENLAVKIQPTGAGDGHYSVFAQFDEYGIIQAIKIEF